jgi:short-subunit dehydrogenase
MLKRIIFLFFGIIIFNYSLNANNQVVLITGASKGVGLATAKLLKDKGYKVYGTSRHEVNVLLDEISFLKVDLKDTNSINEAINWIIKKEGKIDVLINNAGYAIVGPLETLSEKEIFDQIDINFLAPIRCIQACLPYMRQQNEGRIINISSVNAYSTPIYGSIYAASKAALESVSESLYLEVKANNIKVSIIEPGLLKTNFSILMGTKNPKFSNYGLIQAQLKNELCKRSEDPLYLQGGQSAEEVATFIYRVLNEKDPMLRYQTSDAAKIEVSKKLKDITGMIFLNSFTE